MRVAVDLLGGDSAPSTVVEGALLASDEHPVDVVLVGPVDVASRELAALGAEGRLEVVAASQVVGMAEDPVRGVRSKRDATVRVCARLLRDGEVDATVSIGSTGAALAAALFTLGRLPGVTRPGLAVAVPTPAGPVVLLDAGATVEAGPDLLAQFALAGAAFATAHLGIARPRVGLLSNGSEDGKGDALRKDAHALLERLLASLPVDFVGNVEGGDVPLGGTADVVVTDGITGNVLLKGIEGTARALRAAVDAVLDGTGGAAAELRPALAGALQQLSSEAGGGAVLLGVDRVVVIGHGASSPRAVASCVRVAADAVRGELVPRVAESLAGLLALRRADAGFDPAGTGGG